MKKTMFIVVLVSLFFVPMIGAKDKDKLFVNHPLDDSRIEQAIAFGSGNRGENCGLSLKDTAQGFMRGIAALSDDRNAPTTGFSLDVYTPFTWIAQNASWEAKKYKEMVAEQVTEEMSDPVLRVYANPDMPTRIGGSGLVGSSGVGHIIVRSTKKKGFEVLQPLETEEDLEYAQNAFGAEVAYSSMVAYFEMEDVIRISNLDKKSEFFIVVVGTTGEEKKFKVKTKHFKRLP